MNAYPQFDAAWLWQIAGWTMLYFLWMGAVVGMVTGAIRLLLRRAPANVRYATAVAMLAALAVMPFAIATWLVATDSTAVVSPAPMGDEIFELSGRDFEPPIVSQLELAQPALGFAGGTVHISDNEATPAIAPSASAAETLRQSRGLTDQTNANALYRSALVTALQSCVQYLPWLWVVGTPITFAMLATGLVGTRRLRRASRPVVDEPLVEMLARLKESLRIGTRVSIAVCDRVAAPVLVGILRPIILLPPAALTGWSPDEIEMVLLHELAHVRRWDNLVNLAQRIVESLLFFHPVVWTLSGWVRREREACCDTLVVNRTNRPHAYAKLLVTLAAQLSEPGRSRPRFLAALFPQRGRGRPGSLASAMAAGPLRARIRRILQLEDDPMLVSGRSLVIMLASLLIVATLTVLYLPAIGQAEEAAASASDELADQLTVEIPDGEAPVKANGDRIELSSGESDAVATESNPLGLSNAKDEPASKPVSTIDRKVIATFPIGIVSERPNEFVKAVDEARANHGYVDTEVRDQEMLLVTATPPTETDWPAVLGDPPRKDRVIAEKAWERLGLKLVPASHLESLDYHFRNIGGSIKIIGGNVPKGLPLPAYLRRIGNDPIRSFDDLNNWLNSEEGKRTNSVRVNAIADGNEFLLETNATSDRSLGDYLRVAESTKSQKFPALEDQKLADLAYKRLGLEMEAIGDADLKRVRALGYDGGLKVAAGAAGLGGAVIQTGDILVGLHVWPTTSMKTLAEVLDRDDLAELNPLKFYVVYQRTTGDPNEPTLENAVRTGRISVQIGGGFGGRRSSTRNTAPISPAPTSANSPGLPQPQTTPPAAASPEQPAPSDRTVVAYNIPEELRSDVQQYKENTELRGIWDERNRFVVQASPEQHERFKSLLEATPKWRQTSSGIRHEIRRRGGIMVRKEKDGEREVVVLEWPTAGVTFTRETRPEYPGVVVVEVAPGSPAAWQDVLPGDTMTGIDNFGTRSLAELESVIKSLLSGFPSNGKQVNARFRRSTDRGVQFQGRRLPLRLDSADEGLMPVWPARPIEERHAQAHTPSQPADRNPTTTQVPPIAPAPTSAKSNLRYEGKMFGDWQRQWLTNSPSPNQQLEALKAVEAFAAAGYSEEATSAIALGVYSDLSLVAQHARKYLSRLSADEAKLTLTRILSVLKTDLSAKRRIAAIRALAAIGSRAESAMDILKVRLGSEDPQERIAAASAIKMIVGKDQYQKPIADVLGEELGITAVQTDSGAWAALPRDDAPNAEDFMKFNDAVVREQEQLFPADANKAAK